MIIILIDRILKKKTCIYNYKHQFIFEERKALKSLCSSLEQRLFTLQFYVCLNILYLNYSQIKLIGYRRIICSCYTSRNPFF